MEAIPPPPPRLVLENLPPDVIMSVYAQCEDFKQIMVLRRASTRFYSIFHDSSNTILTNMARRTLGDAVELAKEILVYQRFTVEAIPNYPYVQAALNVMRANGGPTVLRLTDIRQLEENHRFYIRFRTHYQTIVDRVSYPVPPMGELAATLKTESQLDHTITHRRRKSLQYKIRQDISTKEFYRAWLLIWRFKYQTVGEFSSNEFMTPQETGKLHFIAFLMDSCRHRRDFIVSDSGPPIPADITGDDRLDAHTTRIINAWRNRSFMGTWFPLLIHNKGIFSLAWLAGTWKAVIQKGLQGFVYLRGDEWGEFTKNKGGSHLLYWKMLCHLAGNVASTQPVVLEQPDSWHAAFLLEKAKFDLDFETITTEELITKYNLD